jgi:peptidyl-prolyl cis-trans isomerase A (cyclophilin A)/peptidyl-prolyl cis-trans isomerase B (cyclophilin B)
MGATIRGNIMRNLFAGLVLLAALPALAQEPAQPPPADQQPAAAAPPAEATPTPQAATPAPTNPPMTGPKILISTSMGDITLQLDSVRAPKSVANVLRYVREKHYDNTAFYRVAKGFVIQMGSFDAKGKGRGIHPGGLPLEANNGLSNLRGAVAMGRGDAPDSATAEFYINLADNTPLDHKADDPGNTTGYAVFGQVISGMDVVDAIGEVPTGDNGPMPGQAPITPIIAKKVTVLK